MDVRMLLLAAVGVAVGVVAGIVAVEGLEEAASDVRVRDAEDSVIVDDRSWSADRLVAAQALALGAVIAIGLALAGRAAWRHRPLPLAFFAAVALAAPVGALFA